MPGTVLHDMGKGSYMKVGETGSLSFSVGWRRDLHSTMAALLSNTVVFPIKEAVSHMVMVW